MAHIARKVGVSDKKFLRKGYLAEIQKISTKGEVDVQGRMCQADGTVFAKTLGQERTVWTGRTKRSPP